ncbi:endonuclease [Aureococcus anophagefferens]|nr:endonuclease [Aureococcus anophagefferens]
MSKPAMSKPTCLVLLLAGAGGLRGPAASRRTLGVRFARPSSAAAPSGELSKAVWAVAANFDGPGRLLSRSSVDAADLFDTIEAAAAARLGEFADAELCDLVGPSPRPGACRRPWETRAASSRRDGATLARIDLQRAAAYAKGPAAPWAGSKRTSTSRPSTATVWRSSPGLWRRAGTDATWAAVGAAAADAMGALDGKALATLAYAHARAKRRAPALFGALGVALTQRRRPRRAGLASACWAFATRSRTPLGLRDAGRAAALFDAIAREAAGRIDDFNAQGLANLAWAYATAGRDAPALYGDRAASGADSLNPQNLGNTAWAFATAGRDAPRLFDALAREAPRKIYSFRPQNLANLATLSPWRSRRRGVAWSFSTAGVAAPELFAAIADSVDALDDDQRKMWHHVSIFAEAEAPDHALPRVVLDDADALRAAFVADAAAPSQAQRDVSESLAELLAHDFEHVTPQGLSLDMAVPAAKLAVEYDGPTHYLAGAAAPRPNGKTRCKRRLLEALGWRVVNIPHFEWERLDTRDQRRAYLADRLTRAGRAGAAPAAVVGARWRRGPCRSSTRTSSRRPKP